MMRKIYYEEMQKKDFDARTMDELREMIGWVEPFDEEGTTAWVVTLLEGNYETNSEDTAHLIANDEMLLAYLHRLSGSD